MNGNALWEPTTVQETFNYYGTEPITMEIALTAAFIVTECRVENTHQHVG